MGISFFFLLCLWIVFFYSFFKASSDNQFSFFISFSWGWSWLLTPVQCQEPLSIILQALCLSDLIPWTYFSLLLYNHKGFDLGHTWMVYWFSLLSSISVLIWQQEFMIWATVSSWSCFRWLYRASPSLAAKNIINCSSGCMAQERLWGDTPYPRAKEKPQ